MIMAQRQPARRAGGLWRARGGSGGLTGPAAPVPERGGTGVEPATGPASHRAPQHAYLNVSDMRFVNHFSMSS
jgi:hypothetical protein